MGTRHRTSKYPQRCRWCHGLGHTGPPTDTKRHQACRKCRGRGYLG